MQSYTCRKHLLVIICSELFTSYFYTISVPLIIWCGYTSKVNYFGNVSGTYIQLIWMHYPTGRVEIDIRVNRSHLIWLGVIKIERLDTHAYFKDSYLTYIKICNI